MLIEGESSMITDNDKTVLNRTSQTPLTPELMEFYGYERQDSHNLGNDRVYYQDPCRCYVKFRECDAKTNFAWFEILKKKGQRYCYRVDLELSIISSNPSFTLYTVQDLEKFKKVLEELEKFEFEVKKKTLEIVEPIENLKY